MESHTQDLLGSNGAALVGAQYSSLDTIKTVGALFDYCMETGDDTPARRGHRAVWDSFSRTKDGSRLISLAEIDDPYLRRLYCDKDPSHKYHPAFAGEFFDWEEPLAHIGQYLYDAVNGGDAKKKILCLWGGHGCGKTSFIKYLSHLMSSSIYYAVGSMKVDDKSYGCTHHCHWLYMLPEDKRELWRKRFWFFDGEPCGDCADMFIANENDWRRMPIEKRPFLLRAGRGIVSCERELPQPPQAGTLPHEWYNALFAANGGMFVSDLDKQPTEFVSLVKDLVMEGSISLEDLISWASIDCMFVHIGNEQPEKLISHYPILRDRLYAVCIRAPLSYRSEMHMIQNRIRERNIAGHFMPHVGEMLAMVACMSRVYSVCPAVNSDPFLMARLYAGEEVMHGQKRITMTRGQLLHEDKHIMEGLTGILPRMSVHMYGLALQQGSCISMGDMLSVVRKSIKSSDEVSLSEEEKKRVEAFLGEDSRTKEAPGKVEEHYCELVREDFITAWLGKDTADAHREELFSRYLEHAGAYVNKTLVEVDRGNGKKDKIPPDEQFLKSIEECGAVVGSAADGFRQEVVSFFFQIYRREDRSGTIEDHAHLQKMIDIHIRRERSLPIALLLHLVFTGGMGDKDAADKLRLEENLKSMGYESCCMKNILSYAHKYVFPPVS